MRKDGDGNPTPEIFIEAWTMAKQKANEKEKPVSYAGFYVKPDKPYKREGWLSYVLWTILAITSIWWGPALFTWLFGTP